jgi:hypothetical protein
LSATLDCASGKEVTQFLEGLMPWFARVVAMPAYGPTGSVDGTPSYLEVTITRTNGLHDVLSENERVLVREVMLSREVKEHVTEIMERFFGWKTVRIRTNHRTNSGGEKYVWRIEPPH